MVNFEDLRFDRKSGTARLSNRMNSILWTIDKCIKSRQPYPALVLIYSSIDILGSLQNQDGFATRISFKSWVSNYLFKERTFSFNEDDLYGARCGIVHTMRYDSQLGVTVKTIIYGFHGYDTDIKTIKDPTQQAGVYLEDLFDALSKSYNRYINDLESSSDPIINANLNKLPDYVDLIPLD